MHALFAQRNARYLENIARRCERNTGWKPMLHYAVASAVRVHGDSSQDGSERSLISPEIQCSIGFQPVFRSRPSSDVFQLSAVPPEFCIKLRVETWAECCSPFGAGHFVPGYDRCVPTGRRHFVPGYPRHWHWTFVGGQVTEFCPKGCVLQSPWSKNLPT